MVKVIKIGEEEEPKVVEDIVTKDSIPEEEPSTNELDGFQMEQKFVKKVYYSIILFLYLVICYFLALDMIEYGGEEYSLSLLIMYLIFIAIILPLILVMLGFTISGGVLIGPIVGLTYGLLSLISRFIIKIIPGLDLELIFPELVGHIGVVRSPNALNRYTSYNLSVEIDKAGLYGNSFWHGNKIAARSIEGEIPVGTEVKVVEAEYWTFSSLLRNSPVIKVVPIED